MKLTKNFNSSEFKCKCCGKEKYSMKQVNRLQQMHDYFSDKYKDTDGFKKIVIISNSSFRCNKKHKAIYKKKWNKLTVEQKAEYKDLNDFIPWGSQHLKGLADDIKVYIFFCKKEKRQIEPEEVAEYAEDHFDGIGRYKTFTHLDSRGYPARWPK